MSDGELLALVAGVIVMATLIGLRGARSVVRVDPKDLEPTEKSGWMGLGVILLVVLIIAGVMTFFGGLHSDMWLFSGMAR